MGDEQGSASLKETEIDPNSEVGDGTEKSKEPQDVVAEINQSLYNEDNGKIITEQLVPSLTEKKKGWKRQEREDLGVKGHNKNSLTLGSGEVKGAGDVRRREENSDAYSDSKSGEEDSDDEAVIMGKNGKKLKEDLDGRAATGPGATGELLGAMVSAQHRNHESVWLELPWPRTSTSSSRVRPASP